MKGEYTIKKKKNLYVPPCCEYPQEPAVHLQADWAELGWDGRLVRSGHSGGAQWTFLGLQDEEELEDGLCVWRSEGRRRQILQLNWQHDTQRAKTKNSAYVAQEHSRCCLRCTRRDSSSSGKCPFGAGKVHKSTPQLKWTLWYHRALKLSQPGFCIPGSARRDNRMNKTAFMHYVKVIIVFKHKCPSEFYFYVFPPCPGRLKY